MHYARLAIITASAVSLFAPSLASAQASFTGVAALTSDYVWRGTTQSEGEPAAQAGFKVAGAAGWYGQVWGSTVDFGPQTNASTELDFIAGWAGKLSNDFSIDASVTHYRYPSTTVDLNWTELGGVVTWKDKAWLQVSWSNDALASGESGTYTLLGARFPINDTVRVEGALGRYWLDDSYMHAQASAVWAFRAPFELRVTAHATDASAKRVFPGLAGSRLEVALQASF